MALELKIQKTAVTSSGDVMTVSDTTGDYDAVTNPTGYGSPNQARNNMALFLTSFNKRTDGNVKLSVDTYDPEVVSEWSVSLNLDGWDETTVHGVLALETTNDLAVGELTYDFSSDELKVIDTKNGSGPWTYTTLPATEDDLLNDSYTVAYRTVEDLYDLTNLNQCNNKANKKYYDTKELSDRDKYMEVRSSLTATEYQFALSNPSKAQEMVESLESVCECFSGDTCLL